MKRGLLIVLALVSAPAAQSQQTFTGVITDSECSMADHHLMQMGPTDADCVVACIEAHGASYVLYDGTSVYGLSDQDTPRRFAAQKVTVVGTLDEAKKTIAVVSMTAAGR